MATAEYCSRLLSALKQGVRPLLPILVLLLYTLLGASIFKLIEGPNEEHELQVSRENHQELIEICSFQLNNVRGLSPIQAYNRTVEILEFYRNSLGVEPAEAKWTFWGAIFYSLTVYTTIGYGNIYPTTSTGRMLTILYAFIGIPLALITLISLGGLFAKICKFVWSLVVRSVAKSTSVVSKDLEKQVKKLSVEENGSSSDSESEDLLSFPVTFLIGITLLWVFLCAWLFLNFEEDWTYGTSLYFTLISFTTIGFGDVLPSRPDYMIVIGICVLIGLSLVSTVLTIIQQQIEALASGMDKDIDKQYMEALKAAYEEGEISEDAAKIYIEQANGAEGPEGIMEKPPLLDSMQMDKIIARMPLKSRLLYGIMPQGSRQKIAKKAEARRNLRVIGTQTEEFLLQPLILNFDRGTTSSYLRSDRVWPRVVEKKKISSKGKATVL